MPQNKQIGRVIAGGKIRTKKGNKHISVVPSQDWRPMLGCEVEFVFVSGIPKTTKATTTGRQGHGWITKVIGPARMYGSRCQK